MTKITKLLAAALIVAGFTVQAQQEEIQYYRPLNQNGINMFESPANCDMEFEGLKVRIGGAFKQQFQALSHSNDGSYDLYGIGPGFNLATANLNFDVQLADGVMMKLENYMSSRHHLEFWVKGGYIQMDKLPVLGSPQWFEDYLTVRVGHFQPNYGDMQFRRSDNGNGFYNPFIGNTIMDAFATEIGTDIRFATGDVFAIVGVTTGLIKGDISVPGVYAYDTLGGEYQLAKNPSILAKLGYDKQINDDLRVRLTGSMYHNGNTTRNTLYAGDRCGSGFTGVLSTPADARYDYKNGRVSPSFTNSVTSFMINPFIKYGGLEFFGLYEMASGFNTSDVTSDVPTARSVNQMMGEVLYRFADDEFYVGARYNTISGQFISGSDAVVGASRYEIAAGWFLTENTLMKLEYVGQGHQGLMADGMFSGMMVEAIVAF